MNQSEELKLTFSGVLTKGDKKFIRVRFERETDRGVEIAEGILPDCTIEKQNGYSQQEVEQLQDYLKQNRSDIMEKIGRAHV